MKAISLQAAILDALDALRHANAESVFRLITTASSDPESGFQVHESMSLQIVRDHLFSAWRAGMVICEVFAENAGWVKAACPEVTVEAEWDHTYFAITPAGLAKRDEEWDERP